MRIVIGNPTQVLPWEEHEELIKAMFETCGITDIHCEDLEIPTQNSIHRLKMHVRETLIEARRTGISHIVSSGTKDEINEEKLMDEQYDSSSIYSFLGDSVSNVLKETKESKGQYLTLQRATGVLSINDIQLDKSKPKSWKDDNVGMGLRDKQLDGVHVFGNHFECFVDALIGFEGNREAKISYACNILRFAISDDAKEVIVRWIFNNLIEYK
ncbi:hypothetical protein FDP41_005252 [Naegleria fowleri]|uniref:Uncharacterized protein n=1 Tax=Naegleria fowleri TaxID=5763 RepID=A0A6A5BR95_NAEFO|nr:uncharacterized protein FDP41_005252 [Naegleria fowleri]KAF0975925.1 hypothetical protein FDP41_005252 [Naegleria fowleri]CAG4713580.1 unnamed protein product [Naegleria fowleri]